VQQMYSILLLAFLACNEQADDSDTYRPPSITDIWYEPVYDECVYAGTIEIEGVIHIMYGDFICAIIQSDYTSYIFSDKVGKEGPFDWKYADDGSGDIVIKSGTISFLNDEESGWMLEADTTYGSATCPITFCAEDF
tara:strand:+ start:387 stop:797 length:411 start_codon:yes stop_codon:yes gene_type:complete